MKGLIVLAVPLLTLILITLASLVLGTNERGQRRVAIIDRDVSNSAEQLLSDAVNGETGVRGYIATGDKLFLEPYAAALKRLHTDQTSLTTAAAAANLDRPEGIIRSTTSDVFMQLAELRARAAGGASPRELVPLLERGKTATDTLRRQVAAIAAAPSGTLAARTKNVTRLEAIIGRLNLLGLILAIAAGLAGVGLFSAGISRRVAAAAANADRLGAGDTLQPVRRAADELGRLAEALVLAETLLAHRSAELSAARDAALRATDAKNVFLSHTSHELRTPLNSVLGFAQLLRMSELNDEDRDSATRILEAGRHLLALINELIDISRIEAGDLNLSLEPVSVFAVIEETGRLLTPLAADRSIEIMYLCENRDLTVQADKQRLSQILVNLGSNAVKYGPREASIQISCAEKGTDEVAVSVANSGPGLSADELERIFIPFERLGAAETGIEGTGIGLPLSQALAEAMGGGVSAKSVPGEGSVFTVTMPRADDSETAFAPTELANPPGLVLPREHSAAPRPPIRVLYVEDNAANVKVVSRYLGTRANVTLECAISGENALAQVLSHPPDLILLDLHLPDMYGGEVLDKLKSDAMTAAVPVVVLSADASPGVIQRLVAHGALTYLTKPIELGLLGDLIDSTERRVQAGEGLAQSRTGRS